MLMEQLDYNLLFRWFVGLNMQDSVWDVTVFTKNRERRHAADSTTPQKTAVYPRIIPRTGQFGTVSELKSSHTLHGSRLKPMANMPHYFKATPPGCRCMAANASDDLDSGSYRRICMLGISACCLTPRPAGMRADS